MKDLAAILFTVAAGCSTTTDTSFRVTGHLDASAATHVVATTPSHSAVSRSASRIDGDGNFTIDLDPGYAWELTFADSTKLGAQMIAGTLQAGSLDALVPQGSGSLDLGNVTIDSNGRAHGTTAFGDVASALGLDAAVAERLGASDDLATRYANPDMDNDGVIDALEADRDFRLDFYSTLHLTIAGTDATIDDLIRGNENGNLGVDYVQTGIVASMPTAMAAEMPRATMAFDTMFYGDSLGAATPGVQPGTAIGAPELIVGTVDGYPTGAVFTPAGHDLPSGDYQVAIGATQVTFADVRATPDAQLAAGTNLVVPFMKLVPTESDCVTDCQIQTISYQWMRNTAAGWNAADAAEVSHDAHLAIVRSHAGALQTMSVDLAATPSADVAWSSVPTAKGMTAADLAGMTTGELCYFSVTYTDQIGIQTTSTITNPNPACTP